MLCKNKGLKIPISKDQTTLCRRSLMVSIFLFSCDTVTLLSSLPSGALHLLPACTWKYKLIEWWTLPSSLEKSNHHVKLTSKKLLCSTRLIRGINISWAGNTRIWHTVIYWFRGLDRWDMTERLGRDVSGRLEIFPSFVTVPLSFSLEYWLKRSEIALFRSVCLCRVSICSSVWSLSVSVRFLYHFHCYYPSR